MEYEQPNKFVAKHAIYTNHLVIYRTYCCWLINIQKQNKSLQAKHRKQAYIFVVKECQ